MNILREKARALGHHRAMEGGDSSSSSSQNTSYNVTDNRSVTSSDSHDNYSQDHRQDNRTWTDQRSDNRVWTDQRQWNDASTSTTTITALDGGAVAAGTSVSLEALRQNSTNTGALLTVADRLFSGNVDLVKANMELAGSLTKTAADAYEGATEQANGNKTMLLTGLAVVGVVAVMAFGKN